MRLYSGPRLQTEIAEALNLALPVFLHARSEPGRLALVVDEQAFTYGQLAGGASRVAAWLRSCISRTDRAWRVGILAARSFETYAGILGTAWAGAAYVPLNPRQPAARLASILERADLDALIVDRRGAEHLAALARALPPRVLERLHELPADPGAMPPASLPPDHPAYIMFTSGTTGAPKGVVVTVSNVVHFLSCVRSQYDPRPEDRFGQFCETSFDVSVFEMFACWNAAASLHIVPENKLMAAGGFIRQHALTVWTSVPSVIPMMKRVSQLRPGSLPSLRVSFFIGESLSVAAAETWQAAAPNSVVDNQYGPTEATVACIVHRLTEPAVETPGRGTLSIGRAYPGMEAEIVAANGGFAAVNEIGELALCGPQLALGYLDDPEQTERRFPNFDHPRLGRSRWYLTGDSAFRDEAGQLHCLGRVDHQVKVMGHRVELEEIEAHLRAVCGTETVAAVTWPIVDGLATGVVAFVSGGALTPAAARAALRDRVPAYMVPHQIVTSDSLPLSAHGKVDRAALRKLLDTET
jgi:amino acid adenylation domain-containing protein